MKLRCAIPVLNHFLPPLYLPPRPICSPIPIILTPNSPFLLRSSSSGACGSPYLRPVLRFSSTKATESENSPYGKILAVILAVSSVSLILEILNPRRNHPLAGFSIESAGGTVRRPIRRDLEQWSLLALDADLSVSQLTVLVEISALLAIEACEEAEVMERDGGIILVPKKGAGKKFRFTTAVLSDGTLQFRPEDYENLLKYGTILRGSKSQVERLKRRLRSAEYNKGEVDGESYISLLDPLGNLIGRYPMNESGELIAEKIARIIK